MKKDYANRNKIRKIRENLEKHKIKMTPISEYQIDKYSKYNQNKTKFESKEIEICQNYIKEQKSKMDKIKNKYNSIEFLQIFLNYNAV